MDEPDADVKQVDQALRVLSEHFDSVQIFCTRYESAKDGTTNVQKGQGDWFARYGMVKKWIIMAEEDHRVDARKDGQP